MTWQYDGNNDLFSWEIIMTIGDVYLSTNDELLIGVVEKETPTTKTIRLWTPILTSKVINPHYSDMDVTIMDITDPMEELLIIRYSKKDSVYRCKRMQKSQYESLNHNVIHNFHPWDLAFPYVYTKGRRYA